MQVVTLSCFRFESLTNKLWAFGQMQFAHRHMRRLPGIQFYKLFGSGSGESFTPIPNFGVYAIMAVWEDKHHADAAIRTSRIYRRYLHHSSEALHLYAVAYHTIGTWDRQSPFIVPPKSREQGSPMPLGVLTRATINKRSLRQFWKSVPEISEETVGNSDLLFKIGIGEIPWLHQVTFSIWKDRKSMMQFAYQGGCHAVAAKNAKEKNWFSEDLFARFHMIAAEGSWQGRKAHDLLPKAHDVAAE